MENVAFDLLKKYPPIELPAFPQGEVCQSFQLLSSSTDSTECGDDSDYVYSALNAHTHVDGLYELSNPLCY
jgi:hypothetical protein